MIYNEHKAVKNLLLSALEYIEFIFENITVRR